VELGLISKMLFLMVVTLPDGSYKTDIKEVTECPPYEVVQQIMNYRLESKEITSWFADCTNFPFFETKKQPT
tara:strand:- start:181 stop:396 length:216 start_codon:yes stop_codon:yes gene_type:complete